MKTATKEIAKDVGEIKAALSTLKDELRVKVHLAGMDAKDTWRKLEPQLEKVEAAAEHANEATRTKLRKALRELEGFAAAIR
jgi:hypothetical protein